MEADEECPGGVRSVCAAHRTLDEYDALVEGVPSWLERSLWRWAMDRGVRMPNLHHTAERWLRVTITRRERENPFAAYWDASSDDDRLALVDFFLHDLETTGTENYRNGDRETARAFVRAAEELDTILTEGGSVWRVSYEPYWCLQRRVNKSTQALVNIVSSANTDAARKIASAWNALYRQSPDYDRAYRYAVLAVEAVAIPMTVSTEQESLAGTSRRPHPRHRRTMDGRRP